MIPLGQQAAVANEDRAHDGIGRSLALGLERLEAGKLHAGCATVTGHTIAENVAGRESHDREVIFPYAAPMKTQAG